MPTIGAIGAASRLAVEVRVDGADKARSELSNMGAATERAGSSMGGMLAKGAGLAAGALLAGGAAAAGFGLKIAAGNEQAQISFTTMLGSAEKAGAFLKDLKAFAASTPFEFPELQAASSSLISAGFEAGKVIPIMTTLGNVTSGMGTGSEGVKRATVALQQMSAAGKITGEDLNQLRDAGIPVFDLLAGATGKTKEQISQLAQAGKLGKTEMEAMFTALETGGGPALARFDGLMEKQSQSLTGMVSTLKDTVGQGLADIMGPAVSGIKKAMPGLTSAIGDMMKQAGPGMTKIVSTILDLFSTIMPTLGPILGELGKTFAETFKALAPAIKELLPAFSRIIIALLPALPALATALAAIAPLVTILANALAAVIEAIPPGVLAAIAAGFWLIMGPITPLMALIIGLALAAAFIVQHWSGIADFFVGLWGKVTGAVRAGVDAALGVIRTVGPMVLAVLTGGLSVVVPWIAGHWRQVVSAIGNGIASAVRVVAGLPDKILGAMGRMQDLLVNAGKAVVEGLIRGIKSMFGSLVGAVGSLVGKITGPLGRFLKTSSPSKVTEQIGRWVGEGLAAGILGTEGLVARAAESLGAATSSTVAASTDPYRWSFDGTMWRAMRPDGSVVNEDDPEWDYRTMGNRKGFGQDFSGTPHPSTLAGYSGPRATPTVAGTGLTIVVQGSLITERELFEKVRLFLQQRNIRLAGSA